MSQLPFSLFREVTIACCRKDRIKILLAYCPKPYRWSLGDTWSGWIKYRLPHCFLFLSFLIFVTFSCWALYGYDACICDFILMSHLLICVGNIIAKRSKVGFSVECPREFLESKCCKQFFAFHVSCRHCTTSFTEKYIWFPSHSETQSWPF